VPPVELMSFVVYTTKKPTVSHTVLRSGAVLANDQMKMGAEGASGEGCVRGSMAKLVLVPVLFGLGTER